MMRAHVAVLVLLAASGCGDEQILASFTSRVIQREVCRTVEGRPEVCEVEERTSELRVQLAERSDGNVWLYGVPRRGSSDRAILGSRDADGGFLFVDSVTRENTGTGCVVEDRLEISVAIDPDAEANDIGVDPCVALIGRETAGLSSSAACDTINAPPLANTVVTRRRWEPPQECEP